ncbi:MAG: hypothetical protein RXQ68_00780 [Candidatus Nanopusillus sp.]
MEGEYDPKEIIKNSDKYLQQTIEEAKNILNQKAPDVSSKDLDSLLRFMKEWTISNNDTLFNYIESELGVNKKYGKFGYYVDKIIYHMFDNYFMAGIIKGISEYAKKLDPKDPDYNEKVYHIIKFTIDLLSIYTFYTIYEGFLRKALKEKESENKEKYSLKDYDDILQKESNYLTNMIENLLEDPIKNREQFYKSLLGLRSYYMGKLTESLSKAFGKIVGKIRSIFYQDDVF